MVIIPIRRASARPVSSRFIRATTLGRGSLDLVRREELKWFKRVDGRTVVNAQRFCSQESARRKVSKKFW